VLVLEIQDRLGSLFLDFKGKPRACFMFGAMKQAAWALRGVLLGVFVGELVGTSCQPHRMYGGAAGSPLIPTTPCALQAWQRRASPAPPSASWPC
jgi:hypothetical protein